MTSTCSQLSSTVLLGGGGEIKHGWLDVTYIEAFFGCDVEWEEL